MDEVARNQERQKQVAAGRLTEQGLLVRAVSFPPDTGLKLIAQYTGADGRQHEIAVRREPHMTDEAIRQRVDKALLNSTVLA